MQIEGVDAVAGCSVLKEPKKKERKKERAFKLAKHFECCMPTGLIGQTMEAWETNLVG